MFDYLGRMVARHYVVVIALWLLIMGVTWFFSPSWDVVTRSGEVAFLPKDAPSQRADRLFHDAFPLQYTGSNVAIVLWREDEELRIEDRDFLQKQVVPELGEVAAKDNSPITSIRTPAEEGVGKLLVSPDNQATMAVVELATYFQDRRNIPVVADIERVLNQLRAEGKVPAGLELAITGSATAGRDLDVAEASSVQSIEIWTVAVVVLLLLLLYRAPLVALIPLATVFVMVTIAVELLAIGAARGWLDPSGDLRIFITVLAYGAGVDYCLFLIARYREELEKGLNPEQAVAETVGSVGHAIVASAATVICGIGMLYFAQFGKIQQAGIVIPFALTITLIGTMTLAPAFLRVTGNCAFWPRCIDPKANRTPTAWHHFLDDGMMPDVWHRIGPMILRRSGAIWLTTVLLLTPFAIVAVIHYRSTNFNPLGDLPPDSPSVHGNRVLEKHFPVGALGPVTLLVRNDRIDFTSKEGLALIEELTENLRTRLDSLELADVRSLAQPLGVSPTVQKFLARYKLEKEESQEVLGRRAQGYYVSQAEGFANHVTRLDLTLTTDPLSQHGIEVLRNVEQGLQFLLPAGLQGSQLEYFGSTAGVRDLSDIKRADQHLIQILVSAIVLVLLVILLRRLVVSIYLIVSVLFSYLATLGITYAVFSLLFAGDFHGLDWKVPIFLFTILVAVGEDYNIFLLTRIKEERHHHGPLAAIPFALAKTGRVISGCGLIMAGTFASLLSGSLRAMWELGFALSLGVLIDTLIVRPILVPAFLVLLQRFIPGRLGRYMALGQRERDPAVIG